jgi:cytochrome c5
LVRAEVLPPAPASTAVAGQSADDLPEGDGKKILLNACTACHDLGEVTKFKGYYDRDEWRDLVKSMIVYGAQVTGEEEEVLVDYLNKHFGKN